MNSSETDSQTPLRYKHRSSVTNFFSKNSRTLLSKSNNCHTPDLISRGPHSRIFKETNSFHVFPFVKTTPTKRCSKIVNPFEAALTERLHLPIIGSPTLFQRPPTPQHSSTQFAWTIDDVSSLQPANVEPHETQFHDSPDPEFEAKAQSAISSYFKEQQIVPSPIDCPLRSQRIILSEISGNTPISKPGRRIRNNCTQTILSLPPILPKNLEVALAPYLFFNENQQSNNISQNVSTDSCTSAIDHDVRDASLRRKLFDYQSIMCIDDETSADKESYVLTVNSPPPQSPEVVNSKLESTEGPFHNSKLSESIDKSSFGSLSPIVQNTSPPNLKRKSRIALINSSATDDFVPRQFSCYNNYRCAKTSEILGSPLCKKSPMCRFATPGEIFTQPSPSSYQTTSEMPIESMFNVKISELFGDTTKRPKHSYEIDLFGDETQYVDGDDMQISQLSAISNNSSESDTPRSKRRSASRKNLSQSFLFQCSSDTKDGVKGLENDNDLEEPNEGFPSSSQAFCIDNNCKIQCEQIPSERSILCRTDSGFNEMTTSSSQYDIKFPNGKIVFQLSGENETTNKHKVDNSNGDADVSMLCCSTPSKTFSIS